MIWTPGCEIFGDDSVAAPMTDRLIHHAEVVARKGDYYGITASGDYAVVHSLPPEQVGDAHGPA